MIERVRHSNDPLRTRPLPHYHLLRVYEGLVLSIIAWMDWRIAVRDGTLLTAEMKIASRMNLRCDEWPQEFWYEELGVEAKGWRESVRVFRIFSPEFEVDNDEWTPKFSGLNGRPL